MDKQLKYQKIILKFLSNYSNIKPNEWNNVENQLIADRENHHYQLIRVGWHDNKYIHYSVFHFEIQEGKVLIRENRTDLPIVDELTDLGIRRDDILLTFQKAPIY